MHDEATIRWRAALLIPVAVIVDQISKAMILDAPALQALACLDGTVRCGRIEVGPIFDLTMVWNRGVSFGLLAADGAMRWGLLAASMAIASGFGVWLSRTRRWTTAVPLALVIGGAIGNMIDRFRFGAVVDFFDFSGLWFPFVFNVADACITVGAVALFADQLFDKTEHRGT